MDNIWDIFGLQDYSTDEELKNMEVSLTGYPIDEDYGFDANTQWIVSGKINSVSDKMFIFESLVFGGYSGGPVWKNDDHIMVGICTRSNISDKTYAVRTNSQIITMINQLRQQWENENL